MVRDRLVDFELVGDVDVIGLNYVAKRLRFWVDPARALHHGIFAETGAHILLFEMLYQKVLILLMGRRPQKRINHCSRAWSTDC